MQPIKLLLLAGLSLSSYAVNSTAASYNFTTFNDPNATNGTFATGLNNNGVITGYFSDNSGDHGFINNAGSFTTLNEPDALPTTAALGNGTHPLAINDSGQVAGEYFKATGGGHGFIYSGGVYTSLDVPGASIGTAALGINAGGEVVGLYQGNGDGGGIHGFSYNGGVFTTIDDPNASSGLNNGTFVTGINAGGEMVGTYTAADGDHGFIDNGGVFTTINDPNATQGTYVTGVNDQGWLTGVYTDNTSNHGFVYKDGVFTTLDVPGAVNGVIAPGYSNGTLAYGINDSGVVSGNFVDITSRQSFEATPAVIPLPAPVYLFGSSLLLGMFGLKRRAAHS